MNGDLGRRLDEATQTVLTVLIQSLAAWMHSIDRKALAVFSYCVAQVEISIRGARCSIVRRNLVLVCAFLCDAYIAKGNDDVVFILNLIRVRAILSGPWNVTSSVTLFVSKSKRKFSKHNYVYIKLPITAQDGGVFVEYDS
jgi:hypothetical protein